MGGTGPGPAGIAESKVGSNIDLRTHPRRIIVGAPIRGSDSGSILRSNTVGVTNCEPDSSATTLRSITVGDHPGCGPADSSTSSTTGSTIDDSSTFSSVTVHDTSGPGGGPTDDGGCGAAH